MFEKEAEEYREKGKREGYYLVSQEMEQEELDYIIDETFKDGAEFGYSKAKDEVITETTKNYNAIIADYEKHYKERIAELEKENAELKEELKQWKDGIALKDEEIGCIETDFNTFKSKAKEIIVTFLALMQTFGYSPSMDKFITEAEQFISEVEK